MKPEQRLIAAHQCGDSIWIMLIHRGPARIEHFLLHRGSLEEAAARVKAASFYEELRAAWPPQLAEQLRLPTVEPDSYLGECRASVRQLVETLCKGLAKLLAETKPRTRDGEKEARKN